MWSHFPGLSETPVTNTEYPQQMANLATSLQPAATANGRWVLVVHHKRWGQFQTISATQVQTPDSLTQQMCWIGLYFMCPSKAMHWRVEQGTGFCKQACRRCRISGTSKTSSHTYVSGGMDFIVFYRLSFLAPCTAWYAFSTVCVHHWWLIEPTHWSDRPMTDVTEHIMNLPTGMILHMCDSRWLK